MCSSDLALGRGTEYQDMPTIRAIVKKTEPSKFQFSSLILEVVKSEPFQMNVKTATGKEQRASR